MRERLYILIFLVLCTGISQAKTIYVSSSQGVSRNSGLEPKDPIADINKAIEIGDTLLLKAGDTFYGKVSFIGKTVSRYGEGLNPIICGFRQIISPSWESVEDNVWVLDLKENNFAGVNYQGSSYLNNIGCFHDIDKDEIHGIRVKNKEDLKQDWQFWQCSDYKNATATDFDKVYLYCSKNPNEMRLEFSTGTSGAYVENSTISHINFVGFGKHGISAKNHSVIKECKIDMIGGILFVGYSNFVCYGNGIEFYLNQNISDSEVHDCLISRCYDCGITIQGAKQGRCRPRNIRIHHNLITHCCQGWEDFLRNDDDILYDNCVFDNNIVLNSGDSGFGYMDNRFKYCNVLGNNTNGNRGMQLSENVFYGGNFYCSGSFAGMYSSNVWKNNTHYVKRGSFLLGNYTGSADVLRVPMRGSSKNVVSAYRSLTGDYSTKFKVRSESKIDRLSKKAYKRFLRNHSY